MNYLINNKLNLRFDNQKNFMRIIWIVDNKYRELYGLYDLKKKLLNMSIILSKLE